MAEETFDQLYGKKGIDTPYEREKITYRPDIHFSKDSLREIIRPETQQSIERARTFTISQNLQEYDELIAEVEQMMKDLQARNAKASMDRLNTMLAQKQFKEIMAFEKENSSYNQTGDYEMYAILYWMKDSMQTRRDFLDAQFRTQFTGETDIEKIQEAELQAINEWEQLEAQVIEGYKNLINYDEGDGHAHTHGIEDDSLTPNGAYVTYEILNTLEQRKRNRELLHVSLADTSYVHRNRYFMFLEIVERAKILVYQSNRLIDKNLKEMILSLQGLTNFSAPKSHLLLQFKKIREKHDAIKGRMMTIDDEKETFGSEKQYLYQQLEVKTVEPLKRWLYDQEENVSGALDTFSSYLVKSMRETHATYEETLADMLNFYKSESDFYDQQIIFLKEKEEIRKFYSILEDLEDVGQIRGEWVDEYLRANGYTT